MVKNQIARWVVRWTAPHRGEIIVALEVFSTKARAMVYNKSLSSSGGKSGRIIDIRNNKNYIANFNVLKSASENKLTLSSGYRYLPVQYHG